MPSVEPTKLLLHRGRAYDPFEHAEALDLQVLLRPIEEDELLLKREYRTLIVCSTIRGAHQRTALAHGIGHWELGHPDDRPKFEHQADRFAALYLIHPLELDELRGWSDDPAAIAQELRVTRRLLEAYLAE